MAPALGLTPNYSLFSIPAYLVIAMIPHVYGTTLLTPTANKTNKPQKGNFYNLPNPRSSQNAAKYSSQMTPAAYAKWERSRAAHTHMLENSAFYVSAVVVGIMTKLDAGYMNRMTAWYLATRLAYVVSYVSVSGGPLTWLRTLWFFAGYGITMALWWEAGKRIMAADY